jgi:hypothetical protein
MQPLRKCLHRPAAELLPAAATTTGDADSHQSKKIKEGSISTSHI